MSFYHFTLFLKSTYKIKTCLKSLLNKDYKDIQVNFKCNSYLIQFKVKKWLFYR